MKDALIPPSPPKPADSICVDDNKQVKFFYTEGKQSLEKIVFDELNLFAKPVHCAISTWSIKESQLQKLYKWKTSGRLLSLVGIFDHRLKSTSPKPFQFLSQFFDGFALIKTHAKITIMWNDTHQVLILGSANWSKNPRIEAGIISYGLNEVDFYRNFISKKIDEYNTRSLK
jgi:hypothetical protein